MSRNAAKVLSGKDFFGTTRDDGGIGKDVGGGVPYVLGRMPCGKDPFKSPFSSNKGIKKDNGGQQGH